MLLGHFAPVLYGKVPPSPSLILLFQQPPLKLTISQVHTSSRTSFLANLIPRNPSKKFSLKIPANRAPGVKLRPIKTKARAATILPNFVGLKFQVHNGKVYNDVLITESMVGHKLGEFSQTRKKFSYVKSKNK